VKTWDVIIVGGGVIGVSLARELRKHGAEVMIVERGEPGREASYAAAGMLAPNGNHLPPAIRKLAQASAEIFPEFIHELEDESGIKVDLREGALVTAEELDEASAAQELDQTALRRIEPCLEYRPGLQLAREERSVDPRALMLALLAAAKHRGIHIANGSKVFAIQRTDAELSVRSERAQHIAPVVVNCCGAWAGELPANGALPVRPVKGQMLSLAAPRRDLLNYVVRTAGVYLVPRSDGRILVGATIEEAGFDKRVDPNVMQKFHQLAANLVPDLGEARILEAWAGLRPGTPDDLPIMGKTSIDGYFVASGHFRNGILLAPITAVLMANLIRGVQPSFDITPFSPQRFAERSGTARSARELPRVRLVR
jgi:glycine oxidase